MERYTQKRNDDDFQLDSALIRSDRAFVVGPAIDRLGCFEDFYIGIAKQIEAADAELQSLRDADKTKTVRYHELFGNKLMLSQVMAYLRQYGLK